MQFGFPLVKGSVGLLCAGLLAVRVALWGLLSAALLSSQCTLPSRLTPSSLHGDGNIAKDAPDSDF